MNKEFATIKNVFQKIGKNIFVRPVLFFLILIVIVLIAGAILLWAYILSPQTKEKAAVQTPLLLNKAFLDKFSHDWALREESFNKAGSQNYPDIFNSRVSQISSVSATSSPTSSKVR
ncbi:MAG: hypothetical protein PHW31_00605 [Candidatus Pacebacteria bacterium]|nr:hypothetical protein [Candidatus Paceibacterota bacterium]